MQFNIETNIEFARRSSFQELDLKYSIDKQSESKDRAKRGSLPHGLALNPAVGLMKKLVQIMM